MRVDLFDFDLPPERIALKPASPRDAARMLVVAPDGGLEDAHVFDLPRLLRPGDALVVNDTRVIAARLDRNSRPRRRRRRDRSDADQASRREPLAGAGQTGGRS